MLFSFLQKFASTVALTGENQGGADAPSDCLLLCCLCVYSFPVNISCCRCPANLFENLKMRAGYFALR